MHKPGYSDRLDADRTAFAAQQESGDVRGTQTEPPTGVAVFGADTTIRSLMDPDHRIEHWSEYDRGGHFAAMEVPDLLVSDIRTFCRTLRVGPLEV